MHRVVLASHGNMSAGVKDSVEMIIGKADNLYSLATLRDEKFSISEQMVKLMQSFDISDRVFVLTDIIGGSVNNEMISLLSDYPNLEIISGMNLALAMTIVMIDEQVSDEELDNIIQHAQAQIIRCNRMVLNNEMKEDDEL